MSYIRYATSTQTMNERIWACRCANNVSHVMWSTHVFLCAVPDTAISIFTSASETPNLGQNHRIHCVVSETVGGLSTRPIPQWRNHDDSELITGGGIILDGPSYVSTLATLTLMFNVLHTSHAGRYICKASLSSPALPSPLVKTQDYNISLQSEFTTASEMWFWQCIVIYMRWCTVKIT